VRIVGEIKVDFPRGHVFDVHTYVYSAHKGISVLFLCGSWHHRPHMLKLICHCADLLGIFEINCA